MRYRVQHATRYAYGSPVDLAAHLVHLRPRPQPFQRVITETLVADPSPGRRRDGFDHFGNHVTWLFLDRPHADFSVTSESVVDVEFPEPPEAEATLAWEDVAEAALAPAGWLASEFVFGTHMAPADPAAKAYVAKSFTPNRPVLDAVLELNERFFKEFKFSAGTTTISTPVSEIMERRAGVCQDFSHAMVGGLRGIGIPARYTSGYIRTKPPPGQTKRLGSDQSHAWVGVWLGPEHGWIDIDPTNGIVVKDEHVLLGWGRDFGDVSPVRGVILGGGNHTVSVAVDLDPIDEEDDA
jgi:transglutaminase-like putative cysteine protease